VHAVVHRDLLAFELAERALEIIEALVPLAELVGETIRRDLTVSEPGEHLKIIPHELCHRKTTI